MYEVFNTHSMTHTRPFGSERSEACNAVLAEVWEDFVMKEWLPNSYDHYYTLLSSGIPETQAPIEILDLGCGGGIEFEWIFTRAPNARITGVDQSEPMLDCLREKYANRLDQFELINESYLSCNLEQKRFDYVVTSMSVHTFRPPVRQQIYVRIHHTLKHGGTYVEGTYCVSPEEEESKLSNFEPSSVGLEGADAGRFKVNLPLQTQTITTLLINAGFESVEWTNGEAWVVTGNKP